MNVSRAYLERCSAESGYPAATLEKVIRLGEFASAIARQPALSKALVLKGGTAFNLCFGEAPSRLSVDLDYNYIAQTDREAMLEDRPRIENGVRSLGERLGYRVQLSPDSFAGRKIFATYPSALGPASRIAVDVNYLWRVPLGNIEKRALWQPGEFDRPFVDTVSVQELCAGKLLAFLDRTAARDAYDVGAFQDVVPEVLQSPQFRTLFIALSATLPHPLPTYRREHMELRLAPQVIETQLAPTLTVGAVIDADELLNRAWKAVEPFLTLAQNEREYIEGVHRGRIRAELLFPEERDLRDRISSHPAIRWKIANVVEQQAKRDL